MGREGEGERGRGGEGEKGRREEGEERVRYLELVADVHTAHRALGDLVRARPTHDHVAAWLQDCCGHLLLAYDAVHALSQARECSCLEREMKKEERR